MPKAKTTITAIEIGTSAIKLVLGEPQDDGTILVHGSHEVRTQGRVMKGDIVEVQHVKEMLGPALNKLEESSRQHIRVICMAVTGSHVSSYNSQGIQPIQTPDRTITDELVDRAMESAQAYKLPIDRRWLHAFQRPYVIDDYRKVEDPRDMVGGKLTANIQILHGAENLIRTAEAAVDQIAGKPPDELVFSGIAAYHGLGLQTACEHGVLVIDIGAGVTEYALIKQGTCLLAGQITVGCDHLANDLSIGLRLQIGRCREIVRGSLRARRSTEDANATIEVPTVIGQPSRMLRLSAIETIAEARLSELFELIRQELRKREMLKHLGDCVVLCGGGAQIRDIDSLAASIFDMPASCGMPAGIKGAIDGLATPRMVTPVGLLHYYDHLSRLRENEAPTLWQIFSGEMQRFGDYFKRSFRI